MCDASTTMEVDAEILADAALRLAVASAGVANYLDHIEHNERAELEAVGRAGEELRMSAVELSWTAGADPAELYADRLAAIESRNVLCHGASFDGPAAARRAETWRALQLVQVEHDRVYHPDVIGLAKWHQLNHYALHLGKLVGATAAAAKGDAPIADWVARRVPDMLLFGLKLATVSGEQLPDTPVPQWPTGAALLGAVGLSAD